MIKLEADVDVTDQLEFLGPVPVSAPRALMEAFVSAKSEAVP
jgi:hypothetical protein